MANYVYNSSFKIILFNDVLGVFMYTLAFAQGNSSAGFSETVSLSLKSQDRETLSWPSN